MDINNMYDPNACSIFGGGATSWTWDEYFKKKELLGDKVILVDMINHPVEGSVKISNKLFAENHPKGTYFVLYCHSGGSSGFVQKQLTPQLPDYHFVNLMGGIGMYPR